MFENSSEKIKGVAVGTTIIAMIGSIIGGIALMGESFFLGLLTILSGCVVAWVSGLLLHAFGELVENSHVIAHNTKPKSDQNKAQQPLAPNAPAACQDTIHSSRVASVQQSRPVTQDEWKCPKCLRINKHYVSTCACGCNRER